MAQDVKVTELCVSTGDTNYFREVLPALLRKNGRDIAMSRMEVGDGKSTRNGSSVPLGKVLSKNMAQGDTDSLWASLLLGNSCCLNLPSN